MNFFINVWAKNFPDLRIWYVQCSIIPIHISNRIKKCARRFEMMNGFLVLFCKSTITRPQHNCEWSWKFRFFLRFHLFFTDINFRGRPNLKYFADINFRGLMISEFSRHKLSPIWAKSAKCVKVFARESLYA